MFNLDVSQNRDCDNPDSGHCDSDEPNLVAGFLVVAAVVRMGQMLSLMYATIDQVKEDMSVYITQIKVKLYQPRAEQEWQAIMTAVSWVVGLSTFISNLIDGFTAFTATPALVATIVIIPSTLGAVSNSSNGFEAQKPESTYLAINGKYSESVVDYFRGLQEWIKNVCATTELTSSGIATILSNGAWLDVGNPYNVPGITGEAPAWLDNLLVTSYLDRVFHVQVSSLSINPMLNTYIILRSLTARRVGPAIQVGSISPPAMFSWVTGQEWPSLHDREVRVKNPKPGRPKLSGCG